MKPHIETVLPGPFALGEGPCWNSGEGALYFVDALQPAIHRWHPVEGSRTWPMPAIVGSFAMRRSGGLIASLQTGFAAVDLASGAVEPLVDPEPEKPANILNDGKCDRRGRFWCGTRDGALTAPSGALYRLDPDFSVRRMDQGFIVSNGIAFSPDDRTMYFADSRAETVFAYDFDIEEGAISNRRVFFSTRDIDGRCDGATVDAEGFYWCALVHGGRIARVDPKGRFDRIIDMPVKHPTMCVFGGDNLDTLYVTSAASMLSETERAAAPQAGALFAIHGLGTKGLPEPTFAG